MNSTSFTEADILTLVKDYLNYAECPMAASALESECRSRGIPLTLQKRKDGQDVRTEIKKTLVAAFQKGLYDDFFATWDQYILIKTQHDLEVQELEFYLNIYFAIYPIHPHIRHKTNKKNISQTMETFKAFLETRGSDLCKTEQFLPFYALPFVPDPRSHPTFKEIFNATWLEGLTIKLESFVEKVLRKPTAPKLLEYLQGTNTPSFATTDESIAEYIASLHAQLRIAEEREMYFLTNQQNLQSDYQSLIEIATEVVHALASSLKGETVLPDYLRVLAGKLSKFKKNGKAVPPPPPLQAYTGLIYTNVTPKTNQTDIPISQESNINPSALVDVDTDSIRSAMLTFDQENPIKAHQQAVLAQALRFRLDRTPRDIRKEQLVLFSTVDILGLRTENAAVNIIDFMTKSYPFRVYKEQISKILNVIASDMVGRDYLMSGKNENVEKLIAAFFGETKDTILRQNVLGVLEKLSVRRKVQSLLISKSIIPQLLTILNDHADGLSNDSAEYATGLLMNLCLRTAGTKVCVAQAERTLNVLIGLLDHENTTVKAYVHAALYTLMSDTTIKETAAALGLGDLLSLNKKSLDPSLVTQVDHILDRLNSEASNDISDEVSEDGDEIDDEDDADEEMPFIEDENEELSTMPEDLTGESFLAKHFGRNRNENKSASNEKLSVPHQKSTSKENVSSTSKNKWSNEETKEYVQYVPEKPATPEELKSKDPNLEIVLPPPPNQKVLNKVKSSDGTPISVEEYGKIFASRPRVARTPQLPSHPQSRNSSKLSFYSVNKQHMPPPMPPTRVRNDR